MIVRLWHGWTRPEQANAYEHLLRGTIFPGIAARRIAGVQRIELLRRDAGEEVEVAVVPPAVLAVLARFEPRVRHFDLADAHAL